MMDSIFGFLSDLADKMDSLNIGIVVCSSLVLLAARELLKTRNTKPAGQAIKYLTVALAIVLLLFIFKFTGVVRQILL